MRWGLARGKVVIVKKIRPILYRLAELGDVQLIQLAVAEANENGRATLTQASFTTTHLLAFLSPANRLKAFAARLTPQVCLRVALTLKHLGHLTSTDDIQFAWVGGHRYLPHNWNESDFRETLYEKGAPLGRTALDKAVKSRDHTQLDRVKTRLAGTQTEPGGQPHRDGLEAWETLRKLGIAPDGNWTPGIGDGPHEIDHQPDPYLGLADHWFYLGYRSGPSVRQTAFSNDIPFGPVIGSVLDDQGNLMPRRRHAVNWVTRPYNQARKGQGRKYVVRWCVHDGFSAVDTIVFATTLPGGKGC